MGRTLHQLAASSARPQGRTSPSAPAILHRQYIARLDGPARHRVIHGEPSLAERVLKGLIWIVCGAYCVSLWVVR